MTLPLFILQRRLERQRNLAKLYHGADVSTDKTKLDSFELGVLKIIYDAENPLKASDIRKVLGCGDRKASATLSRLVGMDLVKSSEYKAMLTDEETQAFDMSHVPQYFIPHRQGDPWRSRATLVINRFGSLKGLGDYQFGLDLWPLRHKPQPYDSTRTYNAGEHFILQGTYEVKVVKVIGSAPQVS